MRIRILLMLNHSCGEQQLAAIMAVKRSAGVPPEVYLREFTSCMPLSSANKATDSGFETRHHQKSKTGISDPIKRTCVHQFFFHKN